MPLTQVDQGLLSSAAQYTGFKNRIINGAMMIDQRNAGASVTQSIANQWPVDRFIIYGSVTSKFTAQQNAGSVTPPVGFTNYLGITSSSAYSITSTDLFLIQHKVEGFNIADFGWGTANAQTVTLSFWVRSSLTGTFGGALGGGQNYPFTYTINSANTWEYKTITIAGSTSGTWNTSSSTGVDVRFSLGVGSTYSQTAGSWTASSTYSATGATSVVGTSGATFYITGVQLEKGSTATSFDYRPYGTELALCQRYYYTEELASTVYESWASYLGGSNCVRPSTFLPQMRAAPTVTFSSSAMQYYNGSSWVSLGISFISATNNRVMINGTNSASPGTLVRSFGGVSSFFASAEL